MTITHDILLGKLHMAEELVQFGLLPE